MANTRPTYQTKVFLDDNQRFFLSEGCLFDSKESEPTKSKKMEYKTTPWQRPTGFPALDISYNNERWYSLIYSAIVIFLFSDKEHFLKYGYLSEHNTYTYYVWNINCSHPVSYIISPGEIIQFISSPRPYQFLACTASNGTHPDHILRWDLSLSRDPIQRFATPQCDYRLQSIIALPDEQNVVAHYSKAIVQWNLNASNQPTRIFYQGTEIKNCNLTLEPTGQLSLWNEAKEIIWKQDLSRLRTLMCNRLMPYLGVAMFPRTLNRIIAQYVGFDYLENVPLELPDSMKYKGDRAISQFIAESMPDCKEEARISTSSTQSQLESQRSLVELDSKPFETEKDEINSSADRKENKRDSYVEVHDNKLDNNQLNQAEKLKSFFTDFCAHAHIPLIQSSPLDFLSPNIFIAAKNLMGKINSYLSSGDHALDGVIKKDIVGMLNAYRKNLYSKQNELQNQKLEQLEAFLNVGKFAFSRGRDITIEQLENILDGRQNQLLTYSFS